MLPFVEDTIVAISTPPGIGGLAVVRISGPLALETINQYFSSTQKLKPRYATFGKLKHPSLGQGEFDDCVVTYFKGPHSATGEDLVEISIHGGAYLQHKLLEVLLRAPGLRTAGAGEFTFRSFLSGRIDLSRAEAVADLIHAKDAASHKNARNQLMGNLRLLIDSMSNKLIHSLTILEAELDFSDQEIDFSPPQTLLNPLFEIRATTEALLETFFYGRRLEEGIRVPLVGAPNSGKSSLFNLLLGEDRAIVTAQAGTTRDTIEKTIVIAGHSVILVDTAGLRETKSEAELSGVDRSLGEIDSADLIILVHAPDTETTIPDDLIHTPYISVFNKLDLASETPDNMDINLSCTTGEGLEALKKMLYKQVINMINIGVGGVVLNSERHRDVFIRFRDQIATSIASIQNELGPEYIASDLRLALDVLGEITGKTTPDDILNQIFSGFCVGK
ncbi:MAG: tRNA uridine-5-carboxymethylaminomethyl(34) synthesis GTPase MnmE [Candidatus Marinimicrobia bacterium]|nr:tRNA uridine-5-carboxymethylaminomethyl(34) synthesis GTPase MnmE [Candidatus Neomarinimicrobiota bacterium]MBT3630163.1 tRNA uridine-5-carboxymethylaminomethyl(34) synthesis GTPase MnmE [Candidatus Neomarinimicrobiota bacterium]MBT3826115.1 tRNA uridine-5-carboxymethylaminomethyl(34) synthesis GTPase MnmE [Candidatus Neomarinimicrobiota bacterium]MBT4132149.1 tRNA uridine-5-carboxymethylaminomethyl(34) synthesis GTPase MnmE [Candidatus Neomarinimicrobiota bacterium]MBT4296636.1 tRNA uridine